MDPWAEDTLLRLLDWITSESPCPPIESGCGEKLCALAKSDLAFAHWLESHFSGEHVRLSANDLRSLPDSVGPNSLGEYWNSVSQNWVRWLASEPLQCSNIADAAAEHRMWHVLVRTAHLVSSPSCNASRLNCAQSATVRDLAYDMAYGLSHELNNPLANIATRARLLAEEEPIDRKRKLLSAIVDQAMRGCEMISDLMLFARPPTPSPQSVDLVELIEGIAQRAQSWIEVRGLVLQIEASNKERTFHVATDPTGAVEAVWALIRNAIEVSGKQIAIRLESESDSRGKQWTTLAIVDDGPGLSDQGLARAFHPYYSGREAGRGLGLGLAKADRLAAQSGGSVTLSNRSDKRGCIARISWPAA